MILKTFVFTKIDLQIYSSSLVDNLFWMTNRQVKEARGIRSWNQNNMCHDTLNFLGRISSQITKVLAFFFRFHKNWSWVLKKTEIWIHSSKKRANTTGLEILGLCQVPSEYTLDTLAWIPMEGKVSPRVGNTAHRWPGFDHL